MLNLIHVWDLSLQHQINQLWTTPALDCAFAAMAKPNLFYIPIALAILITAFLGNFRERLLLVLVILNFAIGDTVITNGLKHAVARPRPSDALPNVRVVSWHKVTFSNPNPPATSGRSFPSSHVSNNTAIAVLALIVFGWRAGFLIPWVLAMAYSRVYVGAHYPTDALGGIAIGFFNAWLCLWLAQKLWSLWGSRLCPFTYKQHRNLLP